MRTINKTYTINKVVTETVTAVREDIVTYSVDREQKFVYVKTSCKDVDNNEVDSQELKIIGENYDLLMSESPDFAQGKPENDFRECDLFYVIDKVRSEQTSS